MPGMSAIAIGVLAAIAAYRWPAASPLRRRLMAVLGVTGMAAVMFAGSLLWASLGAGYLLLLSAAAAALLLALHWRGHAPLPGTAWLRSCGRLSYEIYLSHMFVVFPAVALFRASGLSERWNVVVYVPAVLLCWAVGLVIARVFSMPVEKALRRQLGVRPARVPVTG